MLNLVRRKKKKGSRAGSELGNSSHMTTYVNKTQTVSRLNESSATPQPAPKKMNFLDRLKAHRDQEMLRQEVEERLAEKKRSG